jgi:glyoxylase-like metal-dependent hydrolase (beta-lactamase superfamily II)
VVTPFAQNARVLIDEESREAVVIDPGGEVNRIHESILRNKASVVGIWLTHAHIDHAAGVRRMREVLENAGHSLKLLAHADEQEWRAALHIQAEMFGLDPNDYESCPEPDQYIAGGDTVEFGKYKARVLFTPGHSPGHVSFFFEDIDTRPILMAGDVLFAGSIGRTDLIGGSHEQLMDTLREKIMPLPDDTRVLPGHGPETTIGEEKRTNPFLR